MTDVEIVNPVDADEAEAWALVSATALLAPVAGEKYRRRIHRLTGSWLPERVWGARADGRWVANLATMPRRLGVPAGSTGTHEVAADAVTAVGVAATHRRRGLLSAMITSSLAAAAARGDAVSILWSAEWPIYGRYGYAPAAWENSYVLHPRRTRPLLDPPRGRLYGASRAEAGVLAPAVYDAARRRRAGEIDRPDPWWSQLLGLDGHVAQDDDVVPVVHEGADGADGLLLWRTTQRFGLHDDMGGVQVTQLVAASDDAYRDLWAYLCGLDGVAKIEINARPQDEPIRWQLRDARALHTEASGDALWLRLLDVPAALSTRGYAGSDRLVLEVADPAGFCGGVFELAADGGAARCEPRDAAPDLRLDQRALAACYLGGNRLRAVSSGLAVEEVTPGAIDRFDALFATSWAPWTSTAF
ncbi:GNAT family N-acetyltransferase [uncultured Jatrophihabitans sp.]|uniref:GNAT family N-acetyltransferase n=1 Tax=uncultured Jatrophihabitans sp. TaxID=1610747 RepID=UPI0035C9C00E